MKSIIIYTTKYGSVEKAAQLLESKMEGPVTLVNIMKEKAPSFDGYDNVILGGSIYMNKIQKKMRKYALENLSLLLNKRIGLFICAGAQHADLRVKELETSFPQKLYDHAVCKEILGHEISYEKMNFLHRKIYQTVSGDKKNKSNFFMDKIESFARSME